uniref:NADH-ubiquinone oxidoreductase chain 4 n=1 Tax=Microcosmus sulcatus TaxID=341086 RepID=D2YVG6_9ASCI|nr:NADH dehydrogenase subunit 4 [Microcosmus sulcatus]CAL23089.2 NADH dehydrogenase subunit 4 [Microcosmus sulcatus]
MGKMSYVLVMVIFMGVMSQFSNKNNLLGGIFYLGVVGVFFLCKLMIGGEGLGVLQLYPLSLSWVGFGLCLISIYIVVFSILSGKGHMGKIKVLYFNLMLGILIGLCVLFSTTNPFIFFFFFELPILPMILIIGVWGSQSDRLMANYYFLMYTIIGGIPFMVGVFLFISVYGGGFYVTYLDFLFEFTNILFFMVVLAFMCKLPLYGVHLWLPKAHVEAPVGGSMVLAGLLLKMGGFGVMRILLLYGFSFYGIVGFMVFLGLWGGVVPLIVCMRQVDVKSFIAYSSVSHMSVSFLGLLVGSVLGYKGGYLVFLGHGVVSPAMFYSANLVYERVNSRLLVGMGGLQRYMGMLGVFFMVFLLVNMGFPPTVNFFGELMLYVGIGGYNVFMLGFCFFMFIFGGVVMLLMYTKLVRIGGVGYVGIGDMNNREMFILLLLMCFLILLTVGVSKF